MFGTWLFLRTYNKNWEYTVWSKSIATAVFLRQAGKLARNKRTILKLGNKGVPMRTLWIYLVVKSPEDFLITQWKWLLRPNVPTAIHGQESRANHSLWGKHPWGLPLPRGFGSHGCAGWEDLQRAVYKLGTQTSGMSQPESESLRARSSDVWRQERWVSQLKKREKEFALPSPWALSGLDDDRPH